MNGRRLYRDYIKYQDLDCEEFIRLEPPEYGCTSWTFHFKDSDGYELKTPINHKKMVDWIIRTQHFE